MRGTPLAYGQATDAVAIVDVEQLRSRPEQCASPVPEVALPVLAGLASGLSRTDYPRSLGRFSTDSLQLYAGSGVDRV